jgi:hypothetical protein
MKEDMKTVELSELDLAIIDNALEHHYAFTGAGNEYKNKVWELRERIHKILYETI